MEDCKFLIVVSSSFIPGLTLEKRTRRSLLDKIDSSRSSVLFIKCFSNTLSDFTYEASDVINSNLASCSFFS